MADLRYAWRQVAKSPGSTALAVLILGLGIGGTTAVFSVADKLILNPIPGRAADKLVAIREVDVLHRNAFWGASPPLINELSDQTNLFDSLTYYLQAGEEGRFRIGTKTVRVGGAQTAPSFFQLLGVHPLVGRTFRSYEGSEGSDGVVVLSYGFWERQFGGDRKLLHGEVTLNGRRYKVVGVMPPSFQFPFGRGQSEFWIPHRFSTFERTNQQENRNRMWAVIARLRDGVSREKVRAVLDAIGKRRNKDHPQPNEKWTIEVKPARALLVGPTVERTLWSLQAAMLILLLTSCANVGTLLLSRVVGRRMEFSVRMAIGAGRFRVVQQVLVESLLLAVLAGLCGVFFAWMGLRGLGHFYLGDMAQLRPIGLDFFVLELALLVSALSAVVFGAGPAWLVSRLRLNQTLKGAPQGQSGGLSQRWFQDGLVVAQISLAVVLLMGAALMIRSTMRLLRVDPGLDPKGLYRVWYDTGPLIEAAKKGIPAGREAAKAYMRGEIQRELIWKEGIVDRLRRTPGVEAAAINGSSGGGYAVGDFHVEGRRDLVQLSPSRVGIRGGNYFVVLRLPLIAGRLLTEEDCVPGREAVVVNQTLARQCWPGESPLGKRVWSATDAKQTYRVVGVVKNMRDWRRDTAQHPTFYLPIERNTKLAGLAADFVFRSKLAPGGVRRLVTRLGRHLAPAVDVGGFYSIESELYASTMRRRIFMWLLNILGGLGLFLSMLGIYAVLAYAVLRRTKEIGVRMALGAARADVARLIFGHGGRLVLNGLFLGAAAAFTLAHYFEGLLFQVKPSDPWAFLSVLLTLCVAAGIACYLPSRRATKLDPMEALRYE